MLSVSYMRCHARELSVNTPLLLHASCFFTWQYVQQGHLKITYLLFCYGRSRYAVLCAGTLHLQYVRGMRCVEHQTAVCTQSKLETHRGRRNGRTGKGGRLLIGHRSGPRCNLGARVSCRSVPCPMLSLFMGRTQAVCLFLLNYVALVFDIGSSLFS